MTCRCRAQELRWPADKQKLMEKAPSSGSQAEGRTGQPPLLTNAYEVGMKGGGLMSMMGAPPQETAATVKVSLSYNRPRTSDLTK